VTAAAPRILYIDDDPGLARLVRRTCEARGYVVEHALSGDAGLERLKLGGIDLVALDHHMPGHTGLEVLPRIKALENPPPVVYVTGSEDSRVAVAALKAGAVDYVWKDVQGHFRDLLAEAIGGALEQDRLRRAKDEADREVREARDRAQLLLQEVNHRVANSLALVSALARMQANFVVDPAAKTALEEMQARIAAIAGVHRRLYTSHDVQVVEIGSYLGSLVEELEASMKATGRDHAIGLEAGAEIQVPTDKAVSIGVIVTELVTNAYKYAYPAGVTGDIRVTVRRAEDGVISLSVEDDGIGLSADGEVRGSGLGSRIVKAMATSLQSPVDYEDAPRGTRVRLRFGPF
jgi:two-component sensor histidine kinase